MPKPQRTALPSETIGSLSGFARACVREAVSEKKAELTAVEIGSEQLESFNGIASLCQQGSESADSLDGKSGECRLWLEDFNEAERKRKVNAGGGANERGRSPRKEEEPRSSQHAKPKSLLTI